MSITERGLALRNRLKHHVTGAIERGEAIAIVEQRVSRKTLDRIHQECGYAAAKAIADKAGIIWFASAGAVRGDRG